MWDFITFLGQHLLRRSPMLLLILAGCVFAIVRWKRHPRVSLMTVLALLVYLIEGFAFAFLYQWLPSWIFGLGHTESGYYPVEIVLSLFQDAIFGIILLLLVAAAFTGRRTELKQPDLDPASS